MLSEPWHIGGYASCMREGKAKAEDFPRFAGNLGDLDMLIAEFSHPRYRGGAENVRAYRRMKARAMPGDVLHGYSTSARSWRALMGRAGIALVRNGRAIDQVMTRMN